MKTRHTDDFSQGDFWLPRSEPTIPPPPLLTKERLAANKLSVDFPRRFRAMIQKSDRCWLWTGPTNDDGYGLAGRGSPFRGAILTHRASWLIHFGPIPQGQCVLHQCDNPPCCRPDHLFLGTHRMNMEDKARKRRGTAGRRGVSHKLGSELIEVQDLAKYRIFSQTEIARQYGISRARVSQVAREAQSK
jgi:hypothetical protein